MKTRLVFLITTALVATSCGLIDSDIKADENIGGTTVASGKVGNVYDLGGSIGLSAFKAEVKTLDDGVSSISGSMSVSDPKLLEFAKSSPDFKINGSNISVSKKFRITDKGIQNVLDDGNFTLIEYDGAVGDKYTHKIDGKKVTREITYKSTDNDYAWGFLDIKVMKVTETGRSIPGVKKLEYIFNHKFGIVGAKAYFDDGTEKIISIFSQN